MSIDGKEVVQVPTRSRRMNSQVLLLAAAQALFQTASTLVITIGALAGAQLATEPRLATAPVAALFLGTVVTTVPASQLMARVAEEAGSLQARFLAR